MAHEAGFGVHVIDDRARSPSRSAFLLRPPSSSTIFRVAREDQIPPTSYVVIVTRGHRNDLDALRALAPRDLATSD
jgi:xanthine/CO dehydrogenase XdhC/CoxF family maturation factor